VKADSRGIKVEKELATELPRAMLDRQQIKQVLLNLLLNAMDAIGERGGLLRVKTNRLTRPTGHVWVQIEIEDTGQGISAANLEHIFDPFFTTKHTSGENAGTGLGLTIAHQIIQEHHGEIRVQSTEGVGTTFRINLPAPA
jgi:signal transduction histidine kinase